MSPPLLAVPGSFHPSNAGAEGQPQQGTINNVPHKAIANLAYKLWQQRGCPEGTPEEDWSRAEHLLQGIR